MRNKMDFIWTYFFLLVMELLKALITNNSFFMIVLLTGYFHGHLPFGLSQVMIFIQMNGTVYLIGLFQFFLFAKAVMIFKRSWMDEAPDSWVIGFSRSFALVYIFIRLVGDILASRSGYADSGHADTITKFLTGTEAKS